MAATRFNADLFELSEYAESPRNRSFSRSYSRELRAAAGEREADVLVVAAETVRTGAPSHHCQWQET
ncbi:hypothetical protein RRF57_001263 [Xylaria bambusicola]|uniref:Uncharacterized protein n=1 Tax=Xylaria bambusicola TaxID=326684 RepID=A0AAN7UH16_9PEZI